MTVPEDSILTAVKRVKAKEHSEGKSRASAEYKLFVGGIFCLFLPFDAKAEK